MNDWLLLILSAASVALLLWLVFRRPPPVAPAALENKVDGLLAEIRRVEQSNREEIARSATTLRQEVGSRLDVGLTAILDRQDAARREADAQTNAVRAAVDQSLKDTRAEVRTQFAEFQTALRAAHDDARRDQNARLDEFAARLEKSSLTAATSADVLRQSVEGRLKESSASIDGALARHRAEAGDAANATRSDLRQQFASFQQTVEKSLTEARAGQGTQLSDFSQRLAQLQGGIGEQLDRVRQTVDARIADLQAQNAAKLDEMRRTVDEQLQATLEKRLGESFKLVGDNLERVLRGLGEMQQMAASVGDLKRVLTNVKSRGTWGEVQLASLLENILTPDQYAANVAPRPDSGERVEFAVKLPGHEPGDAPVWLPIDAKFPVEDYERLVAAADRADAEQVAVAARALANRVADQAKTIAGKYLAPPHTTDFGILFLPTEGLYAEVLRQPGLADSIQRHHRVVLAGPTTLAALLNSLQMGFRTLAIEQRASEVWKVLGAVKTEFGKFGEVLDRVQKKLDSAAKEIEQTGVRSRAIERKLRGVESLPADEAARLLPASDSLPQGGDDNGAPV